MTHKEMMNIKYETCDLWNSLKDKSKIVDTLIDLKEQNLKLKAELEELKKNSIVPKFKVGQKVIRGFTYQPYNTEIKNIRIYENNAIYYETSNSGIIQENCLFATKAEAEKALKERI